ncbi:anti-sigma factor domain-containing protein [Chitinophaga sp. CF418]|uniref:anti-sigma factor n=1 Tax=Chitinophaga sp. CF418 TaxID=1855287 RepID=UPI000919CF6F|nr:anti-sigma factor [Chitinophaga sp. CF418]SHN77518.1 Anti-sigma-K factor rskA [Chitinophaga sp. CF418]
MDASRFISSGLIEAYVSGLATSNEVQELERGMTQYPEVAAAVDDCQLDMEQYVTLQSKTPPADLKQRIFHIIINEEVARESGALGADAVTDEFPETKTYVSSTWRLVAAAAIILLLGSLFLNYFFFGQINDYKGRYETLLSTHNSLASESNLYRTRIDQMEHAIDLMKNPSMKTVKMPGTKPFPTALATVYWNQQSKEVFIMVNNLPEPAADKQYQLWAIVDGKPVDMGVFEMSNPHELLQKMKSIDNAEMFAITLEKKGGSAVPTLDQMYVAGKAS